MKPKWIKSIFSGLVALIFLLTAAPPALAQDGPSLPFPPTPSGSVAKRTINESTYSPLKPEKHLPDDAPNILIMMLDDSGPSLPDTFGGDIHTPTVTRLAKTGITYNRFHNTAMCSPTRAALLTGRNHHRVGFGQIAELANDWDGYSGSWPATTASVGEVLRDYGYSTSAFGKWHNTPADETTAMGPFDRWPTNLGFEYFYGFLAGESSQYEPAIVENTNRIETPEKEHYHFTEDMTDHAVEWITQHQSLAPDKPFLMYWAPGAVHGPHHIFKEWADKYKGKFDEGWDVMRQRIFERQKELGWIPADTELTPRPETLAAWSDIPEDEKAFQLRLMEVYAGYVEHSDTQAGRLIDTLEDLGIRDNTLIFYVWGDNGASAEGQNGTISELLAQNGIDTKIQDHIRALDTIGGLDALGGPKTDNMYHAGWAWAGGSPYQATKLIASHFGGTRTPLIVSWPQQIKPDKKVRSQFHHVNDIVPTIYDVLDITPPQEVKGVTQDPMDGVSLAYTFKDATAPGQKPGQYFEIMGSRGYYEDDWIASAFGPRAPWVAGVDPSIATWSPDTDTWELYDLSNDFSQAHNLAQANPEKLEAMKAKFDQAAEDNKVYPIGGGLWSSVFHPEDAPSNPATEFHYTQSVTRVPEFTAPKLGARSSQVILETELTPNTEGVLYALGGYSGGLALWVENGQLNYEYNLFEVERTRLTSNAPLPTGKVKLEVESKTTGERATPMTVTVRANGRKVLTGTVPRIAPLIFTANDVFDVGTDSYSPVSEAYYDQAPFTYNGIISRFDVTYTGG